MVKSLRISDDVHEKLTGLLGELMAQTRKMQTYQDAIEALLKQSVLLPQEMLEEVERFLEANRHLGFSSREEFVRHAVRLTLRWESGDYEYVEFPREKYRLLEEAARETGKYHGAEDFLREAADELIERYMEYRRMGDEGRQGV
jgi:Arc/MetJ-type ribon-helix-helix transcriptional regulator